MQITFRLKTDYAIWKHDGLVGTVKLVQDPLTLA